VYTIDWFWVYLCTAAADAPFLSICLRVLREKNIYFCYSFFTATPDWSALMR
jgi:hypothetical protein